MSQYTNQSAISELADQLFLDTADQQKLNVVTRNKGLNRPHVGFSDPKWRAMARKIMLNPKLVKPIFARILEICVGPQFARSSVLTDTFPIGSNILTLDSVEDFIQVGTVTLDPGLASEEEVEVCYKDNVNNQLYFTTDTLFEHDPVDLATNYLMTSVAVGALSLVMFDTSAFPTTYPYSVLLDKGTEQEEVVVVSNNNTGTNTLTVSATLYAHSAPTNGFLRKPLLYDTPIGGTILRFTTDDTRDFPASGWVRIDANGTSEVVEYTENDTLEHYLTLKKPLTIVHLAGVSVELMKVGCPVETCSVWQKGKYWDIIETTPKLVTVYIPKDILALRLQDASWLHDPTTTASTTLAAAGSIDDMRIKITTSTSFPEAGIITINALDNYFYTSKEEALPAEIHAALAGNAVDNDFPGPFNNVPSAPSVLTVTFAAGWTGGNVIVTGLDGAGNTITETFISAAGTTVQGIKKFSKAVSAVKTIVGASANTASIGVGLNYLYLSQPLTANYISGVSVDLLEYPYAGTDLEEGNLRDSSGVIQENQFSGPYIYHLFERIISATSTTLNQEVMSPTRVAVTQSPFTTNLEVEDISTWPTFLTTFECEVGTGSGFAETRTCVDITFKQDCFDAVTNQPDDSTLILSDSSDFPESDGTHFAGYRIIIDPGGGNEEIATVVSNDPGTGTLIISPQLVNSHVLGEDVKLLNDVLTFDALTKAHAGSGVTPTTQGHVISPKIEELNVVAGAGFPLDGGYVIVNFGKSMLDGRSKVVTAAGLSVVLQDTSNFPTTNYPYTVIVGEGTFVEERVFVTNNNTGTNTLTISTALLNTHVANEYAVYTAGSPEVLEYTSRVGNKLLFSAPIVLNSLHRKGESIIYSPAESNPTSDGSSFSFKMPPDPAACAKLMFELVRAAGVQVEIIKDR
jgi:hypothetical protein